MNTLNKNNLFKDIVLRFAKESHCLSWKVAAIAVKNNRIIGSGINGHVPGIQNCDTYWKQYYKNTKDFLSEKYNIHNFEELLQSTFWQEEHHKWSKIHEVHAEANLVYECARNGICLENAEIYTSVQPCKQCSKMLLAIKPKAIYYVNKYDKTDDDIINLIEQSKIIYKQI